MAEDLIIFAAEFPGAGDSAKRKDMSEKTNKEGQKPAEETVKAEKQPKAEKQEKKKVEEFQKKVEELEGKLKKEHDDYLRLMAEFETFRRRSAEERLALVGSASSDTIKGLLPVLDDCERAMDLLSKSSDEAAREGTALIYNKLMDYLKTKGLAVIEARGAKFDVDLHEAVTQFPAPSPEQKGMVIDVVQTGYTLNGKVLRYAKVVVGA